MRRSVKIGLGVVAAGYGAALIERSHNRKNSLSVGFGCQPPKDPTALGPPAGLNVRAFQMIGTAGKAVAYGALMTIGIVPGVIQTLHQHRNKSGYNQEDLQRFREELSAGGHGC